MALSDHVCISSRSRPVLLEARERKFGTLTVLTMSAVASDDIRVDMDKLQGVVARNGVTAAWILGPAADDRTRRKSDVTALQVEDITAAVAAGARPYDASPF